MQTKTNAVTAAPRPHFPRSRRWRRLLMPAALACPLFGLGADADPASTATSPSSQAPATATTSVQLPLTVTLQLHGCPAPPPATALAIRVQRVAIGQPATAMLQVALSASGQAGISGRSRWVLPVTGSAASQSELDRTLCAAFVMQGPGEGAITATVTEEDAQGRQRWAPTDVIFLLQAADGLRSGKSSGQALWRDWLAAQLRSGAISRAEHDRQLQRLLERGWLDAGFGR